MVPERYVEQGDTVVVMGRDRGRSLGGTAYDLPFVHVWTVRERQGRPASRSTSTRRS